MDPDYNYQSSPTNSGGLGELASKHSKLLFAVFGVLATLLIGFMVLQSMRFHIVKTTPDLDSVASASTSITIYFNKTLSDKGLDMATDLSVKNSYKISGKAIIIKIDEPLVVKRSYTITIRSVSATNGDKITNKVLNFTAQNIAFQDQSEEQQKATIQEQDSTPKPYSLRLTFDGLEEFTRQGLTDSQVEGFKEAIFKYSTSVNKEFTTVKVDKPSVINGPNPAVPGGFYATFKLSIDQQNFNGRLDNFGFSEVRLYLYDAVNNSLIFDSQPINADA